MRFFALETDIEKIKKRFLTQGEKEVLTTHYHGFSFFFSSLRETFLTIIFFFVGIGLWYAQFPMGATVAVLFVVWFFYVFMNLLKAYIDWCYDFIFVTSDKIVIVDQTSIIKQKINPLQFDNIGSVGAETQFWGLFPFGMVHINIKEGEGGSITLKYVPHADQVAAKMSAAVTQYQRVQIVRQANPVNPQ